MDDVDFDRDDAEDPKERFAKSRGGKNGTGDSLFDAV